MRTLTAAAVRELLAQESGEAFLQLLTLTHPSISTLRFVNNPTDITSRGDLYLPFPFKITIPADLADELSSLQLSISNVDRRMVDEIRAIADPISVRLEVIAAAFPDTVEVGPFDFELLSVRYNAATITGTLANEPILQEPFPGDVFNPKDFPALFR